MPFHLAVYSASIASAAANVQLAAITDPVIAPSALGYLVPPVINQVIRVLPVGNLLNRCQLNSASIRDYTPFDVNPVSVGTLFESPVREPWLLDNPIPLRTNEELDVFVTNSAATATQTSVGVVFADQPPAPFKGRMFSVHWTAAVTLTANAFTAFTPVLDNGIPSGTFALVGLRARSAGALFARVVPRGGAPYRPGTTAIQGYDGGQNWQDRYGHMGVWLSFTNTTLPQVEMFSLSADAAQDGFLDLVQTA